MLQQDVVQVVATTANIATVDDVYSTQLGAMADIFGGDDLREMIEAFISESSLTNTRKISITYLNTLGKLSLDYPRQAVLYDITLRIGPLKVTIIFVCLKNKSRLIFQCRYLPCRRHLDFYRKVFPFKSADLSF